MAEAMTPKPTELPPEELARYGCNDCGVNVVTIGEFYMLKPEIWNDQLGLGWDDNLCIGCLERRLGRKVTFLELNGGFLPHYPWTKPPSIRLQHRLFGQWITKRRPYRLRKGCGLHGMSKVLAQAIAA